MTEILTPQESHADYLASCDVGNAAIRERRAGAVELDLPWPPSVNKIWLSRRGANGKPTFYLHPRYASWKRVADTLLMAQKRGTVAGKFSAIVTFDEKRRKPNLDIDNRLKPILDQLQRAGVVENDSLADSVTVRWGYAPEGARVLLRTIARTA